MPATLPNSFIPRELENKPGIVFDPEKKRVLFAEDINLLANSVVGIIDYLQDVPAGDETDPIFSASEAANFVAGDKAKLDGIEAGAEVNNISDANATDLTDGGQTTLHTHAAYPAPIFLPIQLAKYGHKTNPMTVDGGQKRWYGLFNKDTDQFASWQVAVPPTYAGHTVKAKIYFTCPTATSGSVVFNIAVMANADNETLETDSFDSVNTSGAVTVPGTAGFQKTAEITLTNVDAMNAFELLVIDLSRDADNASDTLNEDVEVAGVLIYFE